jgi:hypothetical protein
MSLIAVFSCSDSRWTSPGVVRSLSLLAPCLAPRVKLASILLPNEERRLFQSAILLSRLSSPTGSLRDRPLHCQR